MQISTRYPFNSFFKIMQEPSHGFQKESLMFQKTEVLKKGFTIIEILLSGAIGLLLLFVMANTSLIFKRWV